MPSPRRPPAMRAKLDVDTLVKLILVLVVIWLALSIVEEFVGTVAAILGPFSNIIGIIILLILVLWLLDRI